MKTFKNFIVITSLILYAFSGQLYAQDSGTKNIILTNCHVIDGTGKPPMKDMTVVITGNRITEIKRGLYRKASQESTVRVFDLKGGYVLPGLWDMHAHISDLYPDVHDILAREPVLPAAIRAGRNAMDALKRGFTGIRMVGERDYIDIAWRDAFNAGVFVGPRIFASGKIPTPTEGDYWNPDWPVAIWIDGPYEMRKAMRENIKRGIDFAKLSINNIERDELKEAIKIAHDRGLKVTAHASDPMAGIAVEEGIDCIEHGYNLTDETIRLMAEKGTFFCPTIVCNLSAEDIKKREERLAALGYAEDPDVVKGRIAVAYANERSKKAADRQRDILMKAVKAGVKILSGCDSSPLEEIGLLEIEQLVLSGMTEMQVLVAATKNCAEMCSVLDDLGTVEKGKLADLIVVSENPLDNISNLRKLEMVFKDGKPVNLARDEGQASFWELYFQ